MSRLMAYWSGNDTVVEPINGLDAEWITTPEYSTGITGNAFTFGKFSLAYDPFLKVNNSSYFNFTAIDNFNINFSIKFLNPLNTQGFLMCKGIEGFIDFGIKLDHGSFYIIKSDQSTVFSGLSIIDNSFHSVEINYNNGFYTMILDGVDVTDAGILTELPISNNNYDLYIYANTGFSYTDDVIIDEIKIYNNKLSEDNPNNMKFINGDYSIEIQRPAHGYKVDLHMPIHSADKHPVGHTFFDCDNTGSLDYRVLSSANWLLTPADKLKLNQFLDSVDGGRCETFTLRLGDVPTGFCPFGPDYGDVGDFTVCTLDRNQGGATYSPKTHFRDEIQFVMVSHPAYTLPDQFSEGLFQIGSVSGLMPPQSEIGCDSIYNHSTSLSRAGAPHSIDGLNSSNAYIASWEQTCNQSKAAALVALLQSSAGRVNDVDISSELNYFIYGADNESSGVYTSTFLGSDRTKNEIVISMTHQQFNRWQIPLKFFMKNRAAFILEFGSDGIIEFDEGIYQL